MMTDAFISYSLTEYLDVNVFKWDNNEYMKNW